MVKFPDLPMFAGVNAPSRIEVDIADLEVEGAIPPGIDGAFYRVGADHQFPPRFLNDVPFNGDGMVTMFRFKDGRVSLKSRYVRTDRWKAENAAGRALFGRSKKQVVLLLRAKNLEPAPKGKSYTLSLTKSPTERLPIVATQVNKNGEVVGSYPIAAQVLGLLASGYDEMELSIVENT